MNKINYFIGTDFIGITTPEYAKNVCQVETCSECKKYYDLAKMLNTNVIISTRTWDIIGISLKEEDVPPHQSEREALPKKDNNEVKQK